MVFVATILMSCNGFVATSEMIPTETIETVQPIFTETPLVILTSTLTATLFPPSTSFPPTPIPTFTFPVDRHDPESVIRAYFDALLRSDSSALASVLSSKFGLNFIFESVESIEILEIELISDVSPTERVYSVLHDIQWKNREDTNPSRWKFHLIWDADRDSWIITNYGNG
jgi:hypothetical protein